MHQRVPMRPDFEAVLPPVIDWLLAQEGVDPGKLILVGRSFGGYLAPRAAAHEQRLAALVCDPGPVRFRLADRCLPKIARVVGDAAWDRILASDPVADECSSKS